MSRLEKEVFISYHMDSSTDIVEKISAALEGAGISSWYAKRDIAGGYAGAIIDAIAECKVFLLILNQYSSISAHCLNEINTVFDRLSKHENVVILPFKVDKCELSKDAYYYLGRIRMFDGSLPPEMERVKELVDRISTILGREAVLEANIQDTVTKVEKCYRIVGTKISKNSSFIGRKKELQEIHEKLQDNPNKLFLVGMGGIGKSELTKSYCDIYRDCYDIMLWVSFDTSLKKTIVNDFAFPIHGMERGDYPDDDENTYFLRKLRVLNEITDKRVLIILDNFDVFEDEDLDRFCKGNYSVLFTTRYREVCNDIPEMEIKEITDENELMEIFQTEYKKNLDDMALEQVKVLLNTLNGHPLSIRLVASAMKSNRISPEKMIALLNDGSEELKKKNAKAVDMIFGRLKQVFSMSSLSEEEKNILKNLVLMPLRGIDVEIFYELCGFDNYELIDGLIQKSWIVHDSANDAVHLHPLIADVMAEELDKDASCCDTLLCSLGEEIKALSGKSFDIKRRYFECYASASKKLSNSHPKKWDVMWGYAKMIFELSWYDEAMGIIKELLEETDDLTNQLTMINKISHGYCLSGRSKEGIEEAEKGIKLVENIPLENLTNEQREQRWNLYTRLNEANRNLKNYDLAENYMRRVVDEAGRFPDFSVRESVGWWYMHLARVLSYKGNKKDWKESEEVFEHCLQIFERVKNRMAQGYTYMFYGQLRMYEGKFEEAFQMNQMALEMMQPSLGEQHVDIGKLKLFEANIWRAKGEEENARACYLKAIDMLYQRKNPMLAERVRKVMESGEVGYTN